MQSSTTTWKRVLGFAALSGFRALGGPTVISWSAAHGNLPRLKQTTFGVLASRMAAYALATALWSESVADKALPLPPRNQLAGLASRALPGALTGALVSVTEDAPISAGAVIGAGVAMVVGALATVVRRWATTRAGVPDAVLGLIEDGLLIGGGVLLQRPSSRGKRDA